MLKATISFVMSICPSVDPSFRMQELGSHWNDFNEMYCLSIYRKSIEKIQVTLKNEYFM
jgi:hypothetical protein